jgi:hypothetical protein
MPIDISNVILPAEITTNANSSNHKFRSLRIQETFSSKCGTNKKIPRQLVMELAAIYNEADGYGYSTIHDLDIALGIFCDFSQGKEINSIDDIDVQFLISLVAFMKNKIGEDNGWFNSFSRFRQFLKRVRPDLIWPVVKNPRNINATTTEAHTIPAFRQMILALRGEIDKMRNKTGQWDSCKDIGRILSLDTLKNDYFIKDRRKLSTEQISEIIVEIKTAGLPCKNKKLGYNKKLAIKYGVSRITIQNLRKQIKNIDAHPQYNKVPLFSKNDIIATISHYLPHWPAIGGVGKSEKCGWRVYKEKRGVLIGEFDTEHGADSFAAKHNGYIVSIKRGRPSLSDMNPGEYLLYLSYSGSKNKLSHYIKEVLKGTGFSLAEEYFATSYDMTCVLMYWFCLTGWNLETIRSVTTHRLGFTVFKKRDPIKMLGKTLISITGDPPSNTIGWSAISGSKKRGQSENKPKPYRHISNLEDEYGLYRVLSDYFKLSLPLRKHLRGTDCNCPLVGITSSSGLLVFGPSKNCAGLMNTNATQLLNFFKTNEIYTDDKTPNDKNITNRIRVWTTTPMKIRASFNDMMEHLGAPPWIRRMFLGHTTMDTSVTSYGVEIVGINIRLNRLRESLNTLAEKAFKGELIRYEQAKISNAKNVLQLWEHNGCPVFLCKNRCEPTWRGHEKYVQKGCICEDFGSCMFCEQCIVTEDSLPFLLRWLRIIKEWTKRVGFSDFSLRLEERRQAIDEIIDQCRGADQFWVKALINAEIKESDAHFSAPPFWTGV